MVHEKIEALRKELGPDLVVLAHHYQNDSVVRHADIVGDSLELARKIEGITAKNIVFCGVFFMAETAALLAAPGQKVFLPDMAADCDMARMAPGPLAEKVLKALNGQGRTVVPLTYVNSSLAVKAVVGSFGGAVCTSANAREMLEWALDAATDTGAVLFLPDKYLGSNMADALGIPEHSRRVLEVDADGRILGQGVNRGAAGEPARILLWPGYCPVHEEFTPAQVEKMREAHPGAKIIVHPECPPQVVKAADGAGSTSYIINYVAQAEPGSTIIIGTEINLVNRLAGRYAGKLTILPLAVNSCKDMAFTTEEKLLAVLEGLKGGREVNRVEIDEAMREPARLALERMLRR